MCRPHRNESPGCAQRPIVCGSAEAPPTAFETAVCLRLTNRESSLRSTDEVFVSPQGRSELRNKGAVKNSDRIFHPR